MSTADDLPADPSAAPAELDRASTRGRLVLAGITLGSGVAFLDGSVVNVALRRLGQDLDASLAQLQWVVNGYLLALASLVLVGGALGDRLGRRRVYLVGVAWFAIASGLCAGAQTPGQLIALRVLQGVGAALLTPGALALIQASFRPEDRAPAIGVWAGVSGIATAVGPLLGGWIVDSTSWRWIFAVNVPLCLVVGALVLYAAPESRDPTASGRFDVAGTALTVVSLGAATFALTASTEASVGLVVAAYAVAAAAAVGFVVVEWRTASPLVDLDLFRSRVFSAANGMTVLVYGAYGAVSLFTVLQLQAAGWSALAAGLSTLPITVSLLAFSPRAASLSMRIGPRIPMTVGPFTCAVGTLLLLWVAQGASWVHVLPGMVVFSLGLALLVSPLTTAVLAAVPDRFVGVASGVNNAVARAGSLLAVAGLPALVGLAGDDYLDLDAMTAGFRGAMAWCTGLLAAGGVVSWFGLGRAAPR